MLQMIIFSGVEKSPNGILYYVGQFSLSSTTTPLMVTKANFRIDRETAKIVPLENHDGSVRNKICRRNGGMYNWEAWFCEKYNFK